MFVCSAPSLPERERERERERQRDRQRERERERDQLFGESGAGGEREMYKCWFNTHTHTHTHTHIHTHTHTHTHVHTLSLTHTHTQECWLNSNCQGFSYDMESGPIAREHIL